MKIRYERTDGGTYSVHVDGSCVGSTSKVDRSWIASPCYTAESRPSRVRASEYSAHDTRDAAAWALIDRYTSPPNGARK